MSGMPVSQESVQLYGGGTSQQIAVTTSSAQSTVLQCKSMYICSTVSCFVRQGPNPTALGDGSDQYLPANLPMRLAGFTPGNKIAVIGTGSGTFYITPDM